MKEKKERQKLYKTELQCLKNKMSLSVLDNSISLITLSYFYSKPDIVKLLT